MKEGLKEGKNEGGLQVREGRKGEDKEKIEEMIDVKIFYLQLFVLSIQEFQLDRLYAGS